jgi:copper chaperone
MSTAIYQVLGLTCSHCASAVRDEIGAVEGVDNVTVDLAPDGVSTVTVTSAVRLPDDAIAAALAEAGNYRLLADPVTS